MCVIDLLDNVVNCLTLGVNIMPGIIAVNGLSFLRVGKLAINHTVKH